MAHSGLSSPTVDELARRYARLIRSVVARIAGWRAPSVGEDVEQRVLVALWKVTSGEQEIRHPSSYVYRTAVRETVRILREEHRGQGSLDDLAETAHSVVRTPEELARAKEIGAQIMASLKGLSSERRCAVRAHLAGFSVDEIMQTFDWPYNKARNLIARGMADLRRELRARGVDG